MLGGHGPRSPGRTRLGHPAGAAGSGRDARRPEDRTGPGRGCAFVWPCPRVPYAGLRRAARPRLATREVSGTRRQGPGLGGAGGHGAELSGAGRRSRRRSVAAVVPGYWAAQHMLVAAAPPPPLRSPPPARTGAPGVDSEPPLSARRHLPPSTRRARSARGGAPFPVGSPGIPERSPRHPLSGSIPLSVATRTGRARKIGRERGQVPSRCNSFIPFGCVRRWGRGGQPDRHDLRPLWDCPEVGANTGCSGNTYVRPWGK